MWAEGPHTRKKSPFVCGRPERAIGRARGKRGRGAVRGVGDGGGRRGKGKEGERVKGKGGEGRDRG